MKKCIFCRKIIVYIYRHTFVKREKNYKDTEEGKTEMCKSIEEYAQSIAEERALDVAINTCMDFGKKIDETIDYVCSKFPWRNRLVNRFKKLIQLKE